MHEDLARLAVIDQLDRSTDKTKRRRASARQAIADTRTAIEGATRAVAAAQELFDTNRSEERALHRRLEAARGHRGNALRLLETGQGDPEGAQRQLDKSSALIDELETEMLEVLEAQDGLSTSLEAAKSAQAAKEAHLAELEAAQPAIEEEVTLALASDAEARAPVWSALDADLQQRYQDFRAKRMWAVSRIRDNACNACNKVVRQQHIADLKRGLIAPCMGCRRWLVLPDG